MKIENITITLMVDDCPCIVAMSQDKLRMLLDIASGLSDTGKLQVAKLNPEKFKKIRIERSDYETQD